MKAEYLGDSVYVQEAGSHQVLLTTGNHVERYAEMAIYLDETVIKGLVAWLANRKAEQELLGANQPLPPASP